MLTNEKLKKEICEIIAPYVSAWGEDERIADALITAIIGDVKEAETKRKASEVALNHYRIQYKEQKEQAEVAERAVRVLARKFVISMYPTKDWKELIEQLVKKAKEQAEKELELIHNDKEVT